MGHGKRHRRPVRRRIALATIASGALVVTATLLTAGQTMSAFTDQARLNLGPDGVGAHPFDIVSVLPGEHVAQAVPGHGATCCSLRRPATSTRASARSSRSG